MALNLSNEELNKLTDAVYAKVKANSTAMDELPTVLIDEEGNLIGDVTSLPALRNTELADGSTQKDVVVVPFDYLVLKADLAALRATEAAEIAEETNTAVKTLITEGGVDEAVEVINNATELLTNATTLFNNSVAGINLKASTARFKGVITNSDGVFSDSLAPERITKFDVYYNEDTKKFYVKDPDSLSFWSDWSDATFSLYLQKVTDENTMTESIDIWKDKIYICESSLFVWSDTDNNLVEISGTGSGAGAGFFNVTNLFPISGFYTLETAVQAVLTNLEAQKLQDTDLIGMTISYLDESKGWVDYRNNLTEADLIPTVDEEENEITFATRFADVTNWVRHDATNAIRIVQLDGVNVTKTGEGVINITKDDITALVDVEQNVVENSEKPVTSGAVYAALEPINQRVALIPNALLKTTNDLEEEYLYLAYTDNPNDDPQKITIPDPETGAPIALGVPYGGGGSGSGSGTTTKLKGNLFVLNKNGELVRVLNTQSIDNDLTLYFNASLLDSEVEDLIINNVSFRIGDQTIYEIKSVNENNFSTIVDTYKDVTIDKRYITGNITMYVNYTYFDTDKAKNITKTDKSGVVAINIMNITLQLVTPNYSACYSTTPTKTLTYKVQTTGIARTNCTIRAIVNGEKKSLNNVEASLGNLTRDFTLSPGRNEIFVYVDADYAGEHIESNGIYTEIYYESEGASTGGADILIVNLNYNTAEVFYSANEDNQHPTFYTTTYNQTTAINFAIYKARTQNVPVSVKYTTIDGLGNVTTTNYSDTNTDTILYNSQDDIIVFNNFFRLSYEKGICNIVVAISDNSNTSRTIPCVVTLGLFDFDLPTNVQFDLKASSKSNTDVNPASWTYGSVTSNFYNFNWNSFTGWSGSSLQLNTNAHVSINANAGAINNYTFAIKYKTSRTSDDELTFLKFANLQLTPTLIILGDTSRLLVAADSEVDLIVSCDGARTYIYLNGILSSLLTDVYTLDSKPIEIGAFRRNSFGIIQDDFNSEESGTYIDNLKCTLNIYSISLYKAFVSDNSALGILSLNQTTLAATNAIINSNTVFDTKISIDNMQDYYGYGNDEQVAEQDTYIEPPREPFLLKELDLYNLPKGLRVIIIEGPYLGTSGEYDFDANGYIPEGTIIGEEVSAGVDKNKELDVIDSLNSFNKSNKSLRISASRVVSYITGETEDMSRNFAAYRPVISCQGTSSMNYMIKNYRLYLNKKTKVSYSVDTRTGQEYEKAGTVKAETVFADYNPFTKKGIMGYFDNATANKNKTFAMHSNSIPVSTFCLKSDYADSSGAQNTGGAILTNKCISAISKTPAQNTDYGKKKDVRTSVDGEAAILFSYKWDGWTDETGTHHEDKQFRYRGKINFNNDKSTPIVYGFEGIEGYNGAVEGGSETTKTDKTGFPRELSTYAKNKLREYYGDYAMDYYVDEEVADSEGRNPGDEGYVTTTNRINFVDNIDVGGVQCWEFSTAGTSSVLYNTGGGVNSPNTFTDIINESFNAGAGNHNTPTNTYSLSCLGQFVPISLEAQDAGLDFNSIIWTFIEGEEPINVPSPRPLWATAWESRYPDLDFSLTDYYNTSKQTDILDYDGFKMNPIYLETIYNWISSFKDYTASNYEDEHDLTDSQRSTNAALKARFLDEVDLYFDVRNLCGYYSMTEVMFACDQRVKNMMMSIWWLNLDVNNYDNTEYAKSGSRTSSYGNMEGRRAFFIFYDNDTTFGVANDGTLRYSWDADWNFAKLNNIPGYGYNSILWLMVKACLINQNNQNFHELTNWNTGTYQYSVTDAYNTIRQICATGKKDSDVANTSDCTEILKCYSDLTTKYSELLFNKDVFYKYFKKTLRYGSCSGSRKEHKEWWVDNRMKYLDAKYGTGIINTSALTFYALIPDGGATIQVKGKTARGNSKFYVTSSGSTVGTPVNFSEITNNDYQNVVENVGFGILNASSISGFYWLEDLDIKVITQPQNNGSGYITSFGREKDQMKYLKNLRTEGLSKLFNGNATYNSIIQNDSGANGKTQIPLTYLPSIETLECVNETPRDILDLSTCTKIKKLSLDNAFVKHIIFPSGSNISSKWDEANETGVQLATTTLVNSQTSQVEKTTLILQGLANFRLDDLKVDTGGTWKSAVNGLYIDNCAQLQVDDILNAITNSQGEINVSNFYLTIKGWEGSGDWSVLDKFIYQNGTNKGKVKVGAVVYTPATTNNTASVELKSDICGISGNFYLNIWPTDEDLAKYEKLFPNLTIHYPEYSYIVINDRMENPDGSDTTYGILNTSAHIYNPSNKTGYDSNATSPKNYEPDGHILNILNKRHRVLGKVVKNMQTQGVCVCLLDDTDSTKFLDGSEADLTGTLGDVYVLEPHYWYKGVNDILNGKKYVFYSTSSNSDPLAISLAPTSKATTLEITFNDIKNNKYPIRVTYEENKAILNTTGTKSSDFITSSGVKSAIIKLKLFEDSDLATWTWIKFPVTESKDYGAIFTDENDNVIPISETDNVLIRRGYQGSDHSNSNYYIYKIPEGAKFLYTTVGRIGENYAYLHNLDITDLDGFNDLKTKYNNINTTCVIFFVESFVLCKPQNDNFPYIDLEPGWVEHKPYLCGVFKASKHPTRFALRSISGATPLSEGGFDRANAYALNSIYLADPKDGYGFLLMDYEMLKDTANLFMAKYGHKNSQYILGFNNISYNIVLGTTATLGMQDTFSLLRYYKVLTLTYDDGSTYDYTSIGTIDSSANTTKLNNCLGYEGLADGLMESLLLPSNPGHIYAVSTSTMYLSNGETFTRIIPWCSNNNNYLPFTLKMGKYLDIVCDEYETITQHSKVMTYGYFDNLLSFREFNRLGIIGFEAYKVFEENNNYTRTSLGIFSVGSGVNPGSANMYQNSRLAYRGTIIQYSDPNQFKSLTLAFE